MLQLDQHREYDYCFCYYYYCCCYYYRYTTRDKVGFGLGLLNILLWMCIHIPQLIKSHQAKGKGLAFGMLVLWLIADICGVLGLVLTNQKGVLSLTQFYYLTMDSLLMLQYVYFHKFSSDREKKDVIPLLEIGQHTSDGANIDSFGFNDSRNNRFHSHNTENNTNMTNNINNDAHTATTNTRMKLGFTQSGQAIILSLAVAICTLPLISEASPLVSILTPPFDTIKTNITTFLDTTTNTIMEMLSSDNDIPNCIGNYALTEWQKVIGIVSAMACSVVSCPSKIPQILHHRKRKSTYGLSKIFLILGCITPFTYSSSILIPSYNYDRWDGFRAKKFWLQTFPYLFISICITLSNVVIVYQVWLYRKQTEKDRIENEQQQGPTDDEYYMSLNEDFTSVN